MDYVFAVIAGMLLGAGLQYRFGQIPAVLAMKKAMVDLLAGRRKVL